MTSTLVTVISALSALAGALLTGCLGLILKKIELKNQKEFFSQNQKKEQLEKFYLGLKAKYKDVKLVYGMYHQVCMGKTGLKSAQKFINEQLKLNDDCELYGELYLPDIYHKYQIVSELFDEINQLITKLLIKIEEQSDATSILENLRKKWRQLKKEKDKSVALIRTEMKKLYESPNFKQYL